MLLSSRSALAVLLINAVKTVIHGLLLVMLKISISHHFSNVQNVHVVLRSAGLKHATHPPLHPPKCDGNLNAAVHCSAPISLIISRSALPLLIHISPTGFSVYLQILCSEPRSLQGPVSRENRIHGFVVHPHLDTRQRKDYVLFSLHLKF